MTKKIVAALGAVILSGLAVTAASANPQGPKHRAPVVRQDDGFRNAQNAYQPVFGGRAAVSGGLAEGGAIAAPAGR